jgi:hypothetical protein
MCLSWLQKVLSVLFYSIFKDLPDSLEVPCDLGSPVLNPPPHGRKAQDWCPSGAGRARTDDPKLAKLVLSRLSYSPTRHAAAITGLVVGLGRVELPTSRLSGVRSNQLSYRPRTTCVRLVSKDRRSVPENRAAENDAGLTSGFTSAIALASLLRKEVIQPQVPLRLPCYDFTPVTNHSLGACFLAVSSTTSGVVNSHGVTGGVYKARERIHRGVLIRDY